MSEEGGQILLAPKKGARRSLALRSRLALTRLRIA
jgi:hypothetical protein